MHRAIETGEITGIWSYLCTIDWSERWFMGLGAFHLLCGLLTVGLHQHGTPLAVYFVVLLTLVYVSEYLNEWAASHWKSFAGQQYFDSNGLFISLVFSTPVLMNCLVIVILWLYNAGALLIKVKRKQVRHEIHEAREQTNKKED